MSYVADFDYKSLVKTQNAVPTINLFEKRVQHWVDMLHRQEAAFHTENAKLQQAGGWISWSIDFNYVEAIQQQCLKAGKFYPEAFDPSGEKRLANIGWMTLDKPSGTQSKWAFYSGLLMSANLALNPAFYVRLEPVSNEVANIKQLPALALMPDQMNFTTNWKMLEGNKQDIYAIAILSAYDFSIRPSCEEIAQGMIAVLLQGVQA